MLVRCRTAIILLAAIASLSTFPLPSHAVIRSVEVVVKNVAHGDMITVFKCGCNILGMRQQGFDEPEIRYD